MPQPAKFLLIAFPPGSMQTSEHTALTARIGLALRDACGQMPVRVKPDVRVITMLVAGEFQVIRDAVDQVCPNDVPALLVQAGTAFEAWDLGAASQFLARRN